MPNKLTAEPGSPPRTKTFTLPLLAGLIGSALLSSCHQEANTSGMTRELYRTQADCQTAYAQQIRQGLQNPCVQAGRQGWYGPYHSYSGGGGHFLGYTRSGSVSTSGLTMNAGRSTGFHVGTVSRGGFGSHGGFGGE